MKSVIIIFIGLIGLNSFVTMGYAHSTKEERAYTRENKEFGFAGTYSGSTEFKPSPRNIIKIKHRSTDLNSPPMGIIERHLKSFAICTDWCPGVRSNGDEGEGRCWNDDNF